MSHNCFISFKKEDDYYRRQIVDKLGDELIKEIAKETEKEVKEIEKRSKDKQLDAEEINAKRLMAYQRMVETLKK